MSLSPHRPTRAGCRYVARLLGWAAWVAATAACGEDVFIVVPAGVLPMEDVAVLRFGVGDPQVEVQPFRPEGIRLTPSARKNEHVALFRIPQGSVVGQSEPPELRLGPPDRCQLAQPPGLWPIGSPEAQLVLRPGDRCPMPDFIHTEVWSVGTDREAVPASPIIEEAALTLVSWSHPGEPDCPGRDPEAEAIPPATCLVGNPEAVRIWPKSVAVWPDGGIMAVSDSHWWWAPPEQEAGPLQTFESARRIYGVHPWGHEALLVEKPAPRDGDYQLRFGLMDPRDPGPIRHVSTELFDVRQRVPWSDGSLVLLGQNHGPQQQRSPHLLQVAPGATGPRVVPIRLSPAEPCTGAQFVGGYMEQGVELTDGDFFGITSQRFIALGKLTDLSFVFCWEPANEGSSPLRSNGALDARRVDRVDAIGRRVLVGLRRPDGGSENWILDVPEFGTDSNPVSADIRFQPLRTRTDEVFAEPWVDWRRDELGRDLLMGVEGEVWRVAGRDGVWRVEPLDGVGKGPWTPALPHGLMPRELAFAPEGGTAGPVILDGYGRVWTETASGSLRALRPLDPERSTVEAVVPFGSGFLGLRRAGGEPLQLPRAECGARWQRLAGSHPDLQNPSGWTAATPAPTDEGEEAGFWAVARADLDRSLPAQLLRVGSDLGGVRYDLLSPDGTPLESGQGQVVDLAAGSETGLWAIIWGDPPSGPTRELMRIDLQGTHARLVRPALPSLRPADLEQAAQETVWRDVEALGGVVWALGEVPGQFLVPGVTTAYQRVVRFHREPSSSQWVGREFFVNEPLIRSPTFPSAMRSREQTSRVQAVTLRCPDDVTILTAEDFGLRREELFHGAFRFRADAGLVRFEPRISLEDQLSQEALDARPDDDSVAVGSFGAQRQWHVFGRPENDFVGAVVVHEGTPRTVLPFPVHVFATRGDRALLMGPLGRGALLLPAAP